MTKDTNRDDKGRFVPGNKAAKGRPPAVYADAFFDVITVEGWRKILKAAEKEAAAPGGQQARAWLADRMIGRVPSVFRLLGSDVVLLEELLRAFDRNGQSASDVFNALLEQYAKPEEVEAHDENA